MNAYNTAAASRTEPMDEIVSDNIALVKRIAHHLAARLPENIELDDLLQAGMMGLLEAAGNFDASRGASFETYAGIRIRGAMLDEVRKQDWTPRSVYRKQREVSEMIRSIEADSGRPADAADVADGLGISVGEYFNVLRDTAGCRLFSLDEPDGETGYTREVSGDPAAMPDKILGQDQLRGAIADAVKRLSEREQLVLSLYYEQELNLKEIGEVIGVSESRVCQIHSQAAVRLRSIVGC